MKKRLDSMARSQRLWYDFTREHLREGADKRRDYGRKANTIRL
jgi:hypothetical protein